MDVRVRVCGCVWMCVRVRVCEGVWMCVWMCEGVSDDVPEGVSV